ncbi:hypothetical protein MTO96_014533 [Rhipicephalus appendiculatus]
MSLGTEYRWDGILQLLLVLQGRTGRKAAISVIVRTAAFLRGARSQLQQSELRESICRDKGFSSGGECTMDASNMMRTCARADHELTTRVGGRAARVLRACPCTRAESFAGQRVQRRAQTGFHTGRPSPWHKGRAVPLSCSIFASETKRHSEDSRATCLRPRSLLLLAGKDSSKSCANVPTAANVFVVLE